MPTYEKGDFIKVEFADEATGIGEWMWVRVRYCDDAKELVFGVLDNVPVNDSTEKLKLGTELAVSCLFQCQCSDFLPKFGLHLLSVHDGVLQ